MINKYKYAVVASFTGIIIAGLISACTKPELDNDFPKGDPPPVAGGFVNSSEIATANLVAHFGFEGNINDSKNAITGGTASGNTSFVEGRKGQAYQGSSNGFITYSTPGPLSTLTSFTVSLWINTAKHDGGAQSVFNLAKQDGSFWANFFMIIEGNNSPENRMFMKLHFEKNTAPFVEHWLEPGGNLRANDMYNAWRQVTWTYDAATSKAGWFINGQRMSLGTGAEDRKADGTGTALGPLSFKNASKFVIGGWQNNLGTPFNAPEPWMLNYTGKLDELRIYNKALTDQEISALNTLERQGR
jgi:hypothetical protein